MSITNDLADVFSEEIDAFKGSAEDLYNYATGKPVHTSAAKWAKRAVTVATTVIPVGLSVKGAVKGAKIAGKTVTKAFSKGSAKQQKASEIKQLKHEKQEIKTQKQNVEKVTKPVKDLSRVVYHATGDNEARNRRNRALASSRAIYYDAKSLSGDEIMAMANSKKKKLLSAAQKKILAQKGASSLQGGIDKSAKFLNSKQFKKRPMDADDAKILAAQFAAGALGALATKKKRFNHNDKRWYTHNGTAMVGLNFAAIDKTGRRANLFQHHGVDVGAFVTTDAMYELFLTVPSGCDNPFTIAAAKLGNEMRLHSGANTIYDPIDIQEYLINARSIMAGIAQVKRALTTLLGADPTDADSFIKYTLMALNCTSAAAGTRYDDFRKDAANVLTDLNTLIKTVSMMIPINMDVMSRTEWLFSNFFADGSQQKASVKMFFAQLLPEAVIDSNRHVQITQVGFMDGNKSVRDMMSYLRDKVATFVTDQIHMAIAGDIMKVYGPTAFWTPGILSGTEVPAILYDEEALTQIQNATVLETPTITVSNFLQSIVDGITYTGCDFAASVPGSITAAQQQDILALSYPGYARKVVQTYKSKIDGGDILELTRLTMSAHMDFDVPVEGVVQATGRFTDFRCGTEIVRNLSYIDHLNLSTAANYIDQLRMNDLGIVTSSFITLARFATFWSIDDWSPLVMLASENSRTNVDMLFDFQNWAALSDPQMSSFHHIAALSLFTVTTPVLKPLV